MKNGKEQEEAEYHERGLIDLLADATFLRCLSRQQISAAGPLGPHPVLRALTFRASRRNSRADVVGVADVVGRAGAGVRGRVPHAVPVLADGVDACQQSVRVKTKSSSVYTMRQLMSADGLSSTFSDGKQTKH